jgi:hypothetical protein
LLNAVALLTAIGLWAVALNTTQDELLEVSAAGDLCECQHHQPKRHQLAIIPV